AVSMASRVLPAPPGPVSVTSRPSASIFRTRVTSSSLPIKLVRGLRTPVSREVSRLRGGGRSAAAETSRDPERASPSAEETAPDAEETAPDAEETAPDAEETSPDAERTPPAAE